MIPPRSQAPAFWNPYRLYGFFRPAMLGRAFLVGLLSAMLGAALATWAPGKAFSHSVLDFLHRMPLGQDRESQVLTVELGAPAPGALGNMLERLAAAKPRAIIVAASEAELAELGAFPAAHPGIPLFAAVPSTPATEVSDHFDLRQPPPATLPWAVRVLPFPEAGVTRNQYWSVETPQGRQPTLEGLLATTLRSRKPAGEDFRVDFRGLQDRMPRVEAKRLLAGELTSDLAAGRVVWIARPTGQWLVTPLSGARSPIQDLDFHAAALDTALRRDGLAEPSAWATFLLLAVAGILSFLLLRKQDMERAVASVLLGALVQGLLAWLFLAWPGLLWPAVPLAAVQTFAILGTQLDRSTEHRELLRIMVLDSGRHLPSFQEPADETAAESYWSFIGTFLDQFLHVRRSVFLVRRKAEPRVEPAWAFRCGVPDIRELRRDFRREPYAQCLRIGGPVPLPSRPFMQPEGGESQYLVPLLAYGDVEGFWAVSLPTAGAGQEAAADLKAFAHQIAEMLHARRALAEGGTRRLREDYFTSLSTWAALRTLQRQTGELDRNYRILDTLFDRLSTPTLIYDLFGRVLRENAPMANFLARRGLTSGRLTLMPLLEALTPASREELQSALRKVLLHQERQTFRMKMDPGLRILLKPLALEPEAEAPEVGQIPRPFGLEGLVVEVDEACAAMSDGIQHLEAWTHELEHEQLTRPGSVNAPNRADASPAFEEALEAVGPLLRERRLQLQEEGRPETAFVIASPQDLPQVFESMLFLMAEDAWKDSRLRAAWRPEGHHLVFDLVNEGHGLPGETFQSLLARQGSLDTPALRGLVAAWRLVEAWGGRMEAATEYGQGTRMRLFLRQAT